MIKWFAILILLIGFGIQVSYAQEKLMDPGPHQIFFEKPILKIKTLEYKESGETIPHELTPQKDTILIPNYDGKSRVLIEYFDMQGKLQRVIKSRCWIDPQITT